MIRYEVGEGMEKRSENFAEEVMNQVKGNENQFPFSIHLFNIKKGISLKLLRENAIIKM